jgi:hypothetical protein
MRITRGRGVLRTASLLGIVVAASVGCSSSSSNGDDNSDSGACTGTADLYHRLGCEAGLTSAVSAIATAELANADIASYFLFAGTPGHPTAGQIEACLVNQLSNATGGPDPYPTTVSVSGSSFTCRTMQAAHADLYISGGSFDTFLTIAASTLMTAGVSSADLTTIGGVLEGLKPQIVNPSLADAGVETYEAGVSEAKDGG